MDQTGSRRIYTPLGEWCKMVFGLVGGKTAVLSSLTLGLFFCWQWQWQWQWQCKKWNK
jgi:hypothetical protein